jgi:hypothetical protein
MSQKEVDPRIHHLEQGLKILLIHDIAQCAREKLPYPFELWGALKILGDDEVTAYAEKHDPEQI